MLKLPYRAIQQMQRKTTKLTCISNTPSISLARRIIFALLCGYCFPNSTFNSITCDALQHIISYASFSEMCIFSWNFQPKSKQNPTKAMLASNRRHVVKIVHSFWPHHPALSTQPCA
eukprot:scaffold12044_cov103-Skeletonema_marinoi.AAC.3